MSGPDDFPFAMEEFPFDDRDVDAVFGKTAGPETAPEELRDLAELVRVARRAGSSDELVGEDVIVARIAAAIGETAASPPGDADERTSVLSKFRTLKLSAAATVVVMLGATAAAAASGSLPSPMQSSVAKGLSGVGISVPVHHNARLAVEHVTPTSIAKALHHDGVKRRGPKRAPGAFGSVVSVGGVTTAGTCGTSGATAAFGLTGPKGKTFTVDVDPTTAFVDKGVASPSFANVCVGDKVAAKGSVVDTTVTATNVFVFVFAPRPPHPPAGVLGTVASVNGVTDPGTCGTAGMAGAFTLTAKSNTFTVSVDPSTVYFDKGVMSPSFANVCVGAFAFAKGTVTGTTVAATDVFVAPMAHKDDDKHHVHHRGAFGTVASVNGVTTAGTCGTSGAVGSFTLTGFKGVTFTVNVDTSTKFYAPGVTDPSFANVCIGAKVGALGDVTGTTFTATKVFVLPAFHFGKDGSDHKKDGDGNHFPKGPESGHGVKPVGTDKFIGSHHRDKGNAGHSH